MKTLFKIVFLVIFFFILVYPQQKIDTKVLSGLDAIYNFDWVRGNKIFSDLIEDYPYNPAGYHYSSIVPLWYFLGSFDDTYLDTFYLYSDKALDLAKKMESRDSLTAELAYLLGCIYSNRSIASARSGSYVNAVWASERMKYYCLKALELNDKLIDANIGLGLYNLAVSQIPSSLQWAIQLVGINADRETGIDLLQQVVKKGKLSRIDAMFYLSQIYTRIVIQPEDALKILNELTARYPKNLLFQMSLGWVEIDNGNIKAAERRFLSILKSDEENFPLLKSLSTYQLANIYMYKGINDSAIAYYKRYLESNLKNDYVGISNYNLGLLYEIGGERDSAVIYYENSSRGNMDLDEDSYAKRKGKELQNRELDSVVIRLFSFNNLFKAGNYKIAIDSLKKFVADSLDADIKAEAYLLLGSSYLKIKKYKEAVRFSVEAIQTEIINEKWIHPFAHFIAAKASYHTRSYLDAQLFLNLISDYSDYDLQLKLEGYRYALQRKLNKLEIMTGKK